MELKEVIRAAEILLTKALHLNVERPELQTELKPILNEIHDALNRLRRIKWREEEFPDILIVKCPFCGELLTVSFESGVTRWPVYCYKCGRDLTEEKLRGES